MFKVPAVNPGDFLNLVGGISVDDLFQDLVVFSSLRYIVPGMPAVFNNDLHHAV